MKALYATRQDVDKGDLEAALGELPGAFRVFEGDIPVYVTVRHGPQSETAVAVSLSEDDAIEAAGRLALDVLESKSYVKKKEDTYILTQSDEDTLYPQDPALFWRKAMEEKPWNKRRVWPAINVTIMRTGL